MGKGSFILCLGAFDIFGKCCVILHGTTFFAMHAVTFIYYIGNLDKSKKICKIFPA